MSVTSMPLGSPKISGQDHLSELFRGGLGDGILAVLTHNNCNTNTALEDDGRFESEVRVQLNLSTLFGISPWDASLHHLVGFFEHPQFVSLWVRFMPCFGLRLRFVVCKRYDYKKPLIYSGFCHGAYY